MFTAKHNQVTSESNGVCTLMYSEHIVKHLQM